MKTLATLFGQPFEVGVPPWDPRGSSWHSCVHNRMVTLQPETAGGLASSTLSAIAKKASFASAQS